MERWLMGLQVKYTLVYVIYVYIIWKWSRYLGNTEEIKCLNLWPLRASVLFLVLLSTVFTSKNLKH